MENELNKEEVKDLKEMFSHYDKLYTGTVPTSQLKDVLAGSRFALEGKDLKKFVAEIDPENKGKISFEQLISGIQRKLKEGDSTNFSSARTDLLEAFRLFDKESTGHISTAELIEVLTKLRAELGVSESEIPQLVKEADFDSDGFIDYNEFVKVLFEIEQFN